MAADRVMGMDEGKDAFQDMVAAVKSADERVAGVDKELDSAIKDAVRSISYNNYIIYNNYILYNLFITRKVRQSSTKKVSWTCIADNLINK